jgi:hypothetical protein
MAGPNGTAPSHPVVFQLEKRRKPIGYLLAQGKGRFVLVFAEFDSARKFLWRGWVKGATPHSFETHRDFVAFLRQLWEQGSTHFGLYLGPGRAKTCSIESFLRRPPVIPTSDTWLHLPEEECAVDEVGDQYLWLMPQEDRNEAVLSPVEMHNKSILIVPHLLQHFDDSKFLFEPDAHVRAWFRGHADESWELHPGVYRDDFPAMDEVERLKLERKLVQDFRVMSAGIRNGDESDSELYFLQQHYRMPTRLLDWTNNPLAALYFAVCSQPEKDGAFYLMDAYKLGPEQGAEFWRSCPDRPPRRFDFVGVADSRHPAFTDALTTIFWWQPPDEFPTYIMPVRPDYFDKRITLQRGCFTFHVPKRLALTKVENSTLTSYVIPSDAKREIREQLALLGIDDFSIFGDLEHLSTSLKAAYGMDCPRK